LPLGLKSQFVTPPDPSVFTNHFGYDGIGLRYKEVPTGICELDPNVKSYSGYVDVDKDRHVFFWFFEARNGGHPDGTPLTVWLNGGPGASSMFGLFTENGPCKLEASGGVVNNPHSWSQASHMLYIDQPVPVGFSYSDVRPAYMNTTSWRQVILPDNVCPPEGQKMGTCGTWSDTYVRIYRKDSEEAAVDFWRTLQGFMGAFPQYSRNGFNLAAESYGGKYAPIFSKYIIDQNEKSIPGATKIEINSVMILNGCSDPKAEHISFYNYTINPGNPYDTFPFDDAESKAIETAIFGPKQCLDSVNLCEAGKVESCRRAGKICQDTQDLLASKGGRDSTDIRVKLSDPTPDSHSYVDYLNAPQVQAAVGAYQNFSQNDNLVANYFWYYGEPEREAGTIEMIRELVEKGTNVALIYGDADVLCNFIGGEMTSHEVNAKGFESAGYQDVVSSSGQVFGQVKQAGLFSFVRVYYSGHFVPYYQPQGSLDLLTRTIHRKDLATGKVIANADYASKGSAKSEFKEG
ncbi:serine carboxypeptidase, partial [Violaceomyces palustris]